MPTLTINYTTDSERLAYERAIAFVAEMNRLPASFHRDPADRLIAATARFLKHPLATKDRKIRNSRWVPLWKP